MSDLHFTAAGRVSMDPAKWNVIRFTVETLGGVRMVHAWAIYAPSASVPHLLYGTFDQAIRSAQRYAMFAVVPPEMVPEMLRDNTIESEEVS